MRAGRGTCPYGDVPILATVSCASFPKCLYSAIDVEFSIENRGYGIVSTTSTRQTPPQTGGLKDKAIHCWSQRRQNLLIGSMFCPQTDETKVPTNNERTRHETTPGSTRNLILYVKEKILSVKEQSNSQGVQKISRTAGMGYSTRKEEGRGGGNGGAERVK